MRRREGSCYFKVLFLEINITSIGLQLTARWETRTAVFTETGVKLYEGTEKPSALIRDLTTTFHIIILQRK